MWWGSRLPLGPAEDASYAALTGLPPPTLWLWPSAGLPVAPSGGHSFMLQYPSSLSIWRRSLRCCLYLVGPPEDELRLSSVPGWTRPSAFGGCTQPWRALIIIVHNIRRGGLLRHQVPATGIVKHQNRFASLLHLGMGGAQVTVFFLSTTASPQWRLCQWEIPGLMATAAGCIVTNSDKGGRFFHQSHSTSSTFF